MNLDDIISSNSCLIHKIARKFYGVEKEDLYQAGIVGLLKAYQNYHDNGECKFSSYAYNYIYGEMYELSYNKALKYNKDVLKLYQNIEKARFALAQKYGRVPDNREVASFLELPLQNIEEAVMAGAGIMSLDKANEEYNLYDTLASTEKTNVDDQILLKESMETLNEGEREIIKARYFEDLTQSEVAKKLCMTQVMVSRYEKKSLDKMGQYLSR